MSGDEATSGSEDGTIVRAWHGWTDPGNAETYEEFLAGEDGLLETLDVEGYLGYDLLRREAGSEVEFVTQMRFTDDGAVEAFAGENYEQAHVPDEARELLSRWEDEAVHYELRSGQRV